MTIFTDISNYQVRYHVTGRQAIPAPSYRTSSRIAGLGQMDESQMERGMCVFLDVFVFMFHYFPLGFC